MCADLSDMGGKDRDMNDCKMKMLIQSQAFSMYMAVLSFQNSSRKCPVYTHSEDVICKQC